MTEQEENPVESVMDKTSEKIHGHDSSSSSSSDSDNDESASQPSVKDKNFRLFGRERPVHQVFGGGKSADVFLWRNKKISAGVLGGATIVWVLFELVEYHLLPLICHILILALAALFLRSNVQTFINKAPPRIPEVHLPEEPFLQVASALTIELNQAFAVLRSIASGRDLKMFLIVIAALWSTSVVGSCCNFLTVFYVDRIDILAEKVTIEIKKQYAVLDAKVLSKIPKDPLKAKKV